MKKELLTVKELAADEREVDSTGLPQGRDPRAMGWVVWRDSISRKCARQWNAMDDIVCGFSTAQ